MGFGVCHPRAGWAGALLCSLALVAGCGGDDEEPAEPTEADVSAPAAAESGGSEDLAAEAERLVPIARMSQTGKSQKESIEIAEAQARLLEIAEEYPPAIQPFIDDLQKPDYDQIAGLVTFYVQLGHPGSEEVLVEALNRQEPTDPATANVAFVLIGSGNRKLVRAAEAWAESNGFEITGTPPAGGAQWGQGSGIADPTAGIPGP